MIRRLTAAFVAVASVLVPVTARAQNPAQPLTNLAHLDFLTATVTPPHQARHTTYHLGSEPGVGTLWVYATHNDDGSYTRVGGGTYHPETDTYDQGAYDADDIARAAVVYLRHWRQFGDDHSRRQAYALLRGLTYLQTASGPNAGNVVLWMQPDGALDPSAIPAEQPDPSDSANSYWLARTVWALGEGYAAFHDQDTGFAAFLRDRMDLALGALNRDSLSRYGEHLTVDGVRRPAWLVVDGADASGEAVLGLSAFVTAGGTEARTPLRELARGISALATPAGPRWPYGAVLPSATSLSTWHAWAGLAPAALATASTALDRPSLADGALRDSAGFDPDLLTSYGAINGLTPAPTDKSQIAYGVDSRIQSLLATADATGRAALRQLAGVFAGWYFGQNPAATPTYEPATGVTYDGVSADGVVNENSGAESTIHGLLSMLALDAHPAVARLAETSGRVVQRIGTALVEGESATTTGPATVVTPDPPSSAESAWSGGRALRLEPGATATWALPKSAQPRVLEAVVDRERKTSAQARFHGVGTADFGGGGPQGASAVPGELVPVVVGTIAAGARQVTADETGGAGDVDALLATPVITSLRTPGSEVLTNSGDRTRLVTLPRVGDVRSYDDRCRLMQVGSLRSVRVVPDGFAVVTFS